LSPYPFWGTVAKVRDYAHDSRLVRHAYRYAALRHAGQVKDSDGSPYLDHLVAVARLVEVAGYDDDVIAAALLHDVVEKAGATIDELRGEFGDDVADLVAAMTEPEGIPSWARRKRVHREAIAHADPRARALFIADKAANAASLRRALDRGEKPPRFKDKLGHYKATLTMLSGDPMARRLRDELDRLSLERPPAAKPSQLQTPS
jgi:(p)ppGpp synthase/HD superfamily hydrolase